MYLSTPRIQRLIRLLATDWIDQRAELSTRPVHHYETLPHLPTIYILTREDLIIYVGQTYDLRLRIAQHNTQGKLDFDTVHWFEPGVRTQCLRLKAETMLIAAICPEGNQALMLRICKSHQLAEIRWRRAR